MFKYATLNNIAEAGLARFDENFEKTDDINEAQGILVRSAKMHDMEFSDKLLAVARAGAGVNNIPLDRLAEKGVVVFNTPGANANGVKELVIAGMLLASRDITEGIDWVRSNWNNPDITSDVEKQKKQFQRSMRGLQDVSGTRLAETWKMELFHESLNKTLEGFTRLLD